MSQISPPIRILLVAVIGLVAVYMLFLKPKAPTAPPVAATPAAATPVPAKDPGAATSSGPGRIVQKAVTDTNAASAQAKVAAGENPGGLASDATPATGTGVSTNPTTQALAPGQAAQPAALSKQALAALPLDVRGAVKSRKVVALLFYNNRSADDKAVRRALSHVDRFGGQVFVDAHWIKNVAPYQAITRGADLEQSPTIVVTDRNLKAETLVGYVNTETIQQAVVDALRRSGGSTIKDPYFRQVDALCVSGKQQAKALSAPSSASALPAYLAAALQINVGLDAKFVAIKAPKAHQSFAKAFARKNASEAGLFSSATKRVTANPAKGQSILRSTQAKVKASDKRFVAQHGSHGLSCF
jgi:hypothetical protein